MQNQLTAEEREKLEELSVLRSLDLLEAPQRQEYQSLVERAGLLERGELRKLSDVAAAIGVSTDPVTPPARVKEQLLASIRAQQFQKVASNDGWNEHSIDGVRWKLLKLSATRATVLMEMDAGRQFPHHEHSGDEECYVVHGSLITGETVLNEGDFLFAARGTSHGPLTTPEGCTLLLGLSPADFRGITA